MPKLSLSRNFLLEVMQSQPVRDGLLAKARRIQAEAQAMAAQEGLDDFETEVVEGIRPKGRPYARVVGPLEDEWGSEYRPKRRILGRLAGVHNTPK